MKRLYIILFSLVIILAPSQISAIEEKAEADQSTESAGIDPDTIKENIKKRIEQVIRDQRDTKPEKKTAYLGTISSMTPNSFTLETNQGNIEQASTSAYTTYIDISTNKEVKQEDASIGDFVAALGFITSDNEVLDTRRLLILKTPPPKPKKSSFFGSISNIDIKKNRIEISSIDKSQTKLFSISAKTTIKTSNPNQLTSQDLTIEELNLGQVGLIIYTPASASTSASPADNLLIKGSTPTNDDSN